MRLVGRGMRTTSSLRSVTLFRGADKGLDADRPGRLSLVTETSSLNSGTLFGSAAEGLDVVGFGRESLVTKTSFLLSAISAFVASPVGLEGLGIRSEASNSEVVRLRGLWG